MKILLILGLILSASGLLGLLRCVILGLRVKKFEKSESHNKEDLKQLLGNLSVINMASLSASMLGLIIVTTAIILN